MASMYQSSSFDQAGITRDYQMVPKSPDLSVTYNEVITPTVSVVYERPNYVICNKAGTYNFLYNTFNFLVTLVITGVSTSVISLI